MTLTMTVARRHRGFTLVEVMITVAIVAILVAIAYPSYDAHLRKGRRAAAQSFLIDVANRQQQYLVDARNYAVGSNALASLNITEPTDVSRFYAVTVQPAAIASPPRFTLTATPVAGTSQVLDGALTIDNTGAKTRNGVQGW